ncbi:SRPBCC family protein [Flexivirga sp.]|uniref:SRPBCC family protein n=1 Tax=Flexivirga sp. TaxID=1962927 RepID=UPI003F7EF871
MSDDTRISVSRTIDAPAAAIFEVLTLPANHVRLDGSGFVRSAVGTDRISGTGDVFTMNMEGDHMGGEYQTDNHVTGYEKDKLLAWQTAPAGTQPPGWEWVWELTPQGPDQTEVSQTYDWSRVTDKELLSQNLFPLVSRDQLEDTLAKVAELVA